ncbi:MAG: hypothetical protein ABI141_00585 [Gemmatimonadaceae bacterium]
MSASSASANQGQLGVALDGTLLSCVWRAASAPRGSSPWRTLVVPCDGTPSGIAAALREVAGQVPSCRDVAFVVQRPLATARTITLPKMRRADVESVLGRDWARYVIGFRAEPHLAAVRADGAGEWRAAFAPVATLEALEAGAREHGWALRDVRSSDDALAAVAREVMPTVARISDVLVVQCGATSATDVAHLRRGVAVSGRQLLAGAASEITAFAQQALRGKSAKHSAAVIVVGDTEHGNALARELGKGGMQAQYLSFARFTSESPAAVLAAGSLLHPAQLPLISPSERAARVHRARVATRWLVAATVALAAVGLAIENQRLGAALDDVARQRAAIAPRVSEAVARRARLESVADAASALAGYEAQASRASAAIAAIALTLPDNASLSVLHIAGDSVHMEGESDRSADVYDALRVAPALEAVRLAGPLRQERQADGEPVEHFAFVARLRRGVR